MVPNNKNKGGEKMGYRTAQQRPKTNHFNRFERFTKLQVWPAYVGCLSAFFYAVFVRFYQAAGGEIGLPGVLEEGMDQFYMTSYVAGLLIMFCGFALIALVKPWSKIVPQQVPIIGSKRIHPLLLLIPTLTGTAYLIAHGASGILTKLLHLLGVITLRFPAWIELDIRQFVLWDLLFYEPWFLFMGIMAGLTAAHYAQASDIKPTTFRIGTILFVFVVIILTVQFVVEIISNFS
jgi:hypothetical protein